MKLHDNLLDRQRQLHGLNGLLGVGASFMLSLVLGNAETRRHDHAPDRERALAGCSGAHSNAVDRMRRVIA
jgi:hypothetical protein